MQAKGQDQDYLRNEQYKSSNNFMDRVALSARFSTNPYRWTQWLLDQIDVPNDARILELGAGPAILWIANRKRVPPGWHITLSDFSPGMVDEQRRNLREVGGDFNFEVIDAQSIPHDDGSFDAVIANHMLYHVPDIPRAVAEVRRVLRPDGKFYAATNGLNDLRELRELLARFSPRLGKRESPIAAFSLENGELLLATAFAQIERRFHPNALEVTEAQPLVDYVMSAVTTRSPETERFAERFSAFVDQEIKKTRALHMSKDAGLFIASNPTR